MARIRSDKSAIVLPDPMPDLDGPYQPGITDPQWPPTLPRGSGFDQRKYLADLSGRVQIQDHMAIVLADVHERADRRELASLLEALSAFANEQMPRRPSERHLPYLKSIPKSYRLTITIAFGWKLFCNEHGDDRFGINSFRPRRLQPMPRITGDAPLFDPVRDATDLAIVVCSDHPYVNVAVSRALAHGFAHRSLVVRRIEQGFARPDKREFLRFDDGIDNLRNDTPERELNHRVYVQRGDDEPDWCVAGSYLVYRKIRENLKTWEHLDPHQKKCEALQEMMIGRHKASGKPLEPNPTGPDRMTPNFRNPTNGRYTPLDAHIRKVQPRRPGSDLFGGNDLDRRFLRRGYPFCYGIDGTGDVECGLHFVAYMRDLRAQFDWATHMWQMNPDFPVKRTGIDALYKNGVLSTVGGGYYFCPPAARRRGDFIGKAIAGN
jgi:deferrochelatase/peroxidase EfeB